MKTIDQPTPEVVIIDGQRYRLEKQSKLPTVQELNNAWNEGTRELHGTPYSNFGDVCDPHWLRCVIRGRFAANAIRAKEPKGDGDYRVMINRDGTYEVCDAVYRDVGAEYFSTRDGAELWREFMGEDLKHL